MNTRQKRDPVYYWLMPMTAIILVSFGWVCTCDFLNYDDNLHVYENPYLQEFTLSNLIQFWSEPYAGMYIPITYTFWALQAGVAKNFPGKSELCTLNPLIFHACNLLMHILATFLVFGILRFFVEDDFACCVGAMLFALHPVQVEQVAWISGFKGLLAAVFSFAALYLYLLHTRNRNWLRYGFAIILFLMSLLSQPNAVVIPVVAGILVFGMDRRPAKLILAELFPWLLASIPVALLAKFSQPDIMLEFVPTLRQRVWIAVDTMVFYLGKLGFPGQLGIDYGRTPENVLHSGWVYAECFFLMAGLFVAWKKGNRYLWTCLAIFFVCLMPVLGFIPFFFQIISTVADRYLYVAMLAPSLGLAFLFAYQKTKRTRAMFLVVLGILGICTMVQTMRWQNSYIVYQQALRVNPDSVLSHNNLGLILESRGEWIEAIAHFSEAVRLKPNYSIGHNNLAVALEKISRWDQAIEHYRLAIRFQPDYENAHYNLGVCLRSQGKREEALFHLKKAQAIKISRSPKKR